MAELNATARYGLPPTVWLALPALLILSVFFIVPMFAMVRNSFNTQLSSGVMQSGFTLDNYIRFFGT